MTLCSTIQAKRQADQRERQQGRYRARTALWSLSSLPSVQSCGLAPIPGHSITAKVSTGRDGTRLAGYGGLLTCGSVWACAVCSGKIAAARQVEVEQAIDTWRAMGHGLAFVTLTQRHSKGQGLAGLWDALYDAWHAATSGHDWALEQQPLGVLVHRVIKSGKRAGEVRSARRILTLRVVEVTFGLNGWHVHVHALLFLRREVMQATVDALVDGMWRRWAAALVRAGLRAPLRHKGGLDARPVYGREASAAFGSYFTKATYVGGGGPSAEMMRADRKKGRGLSRTPWELLDSVTGMGEFRPGDLELWLEWETASKRRHQMQWAPGLRELLAVAVVTDAEIAAEEQGGRVVATLAVESWQAITYARRTYLRLFRTLCDSDVAFFELLDQLGACYVRGDPEPVPP